MWELIFRTFMTIAWIFIMVMIFKNSAKLTAEKAKVEQLKREKAQLERELKSSKSEEERVKQQILTIKDKTKIEEIAKERIESRKATTASVIPTSSPASKRKHTGRSSFNVTTGSQSARSGSTQPSSFDPILYSTALDTSSDDSHRHSHSSSHHYDSGSSSHSHSSSSHSSSHDSGSSYSHDSGSSSSYDSGGGGSFD